ncbi:MAG TPA: diol dehydratase small subunit [Anaerolineae bacterium]|nr:diol dehydratase small subunit [Anaerolineae bacterium]MCB9104770.1 diol dehydratase small subunit [Anaerolineales bacterium]HRV92332.1 diol dehydratase small subunit [Anaerolineae bacterium]
MSQQDMIAAIVQEVLKEMNGGGVKSVVSAPASNGGKLDYRSDYPLAEKRPELVKTATGKSLNEITLDAVVSGAIKPEEIRITPQTLEYQAQVAESIGRPQMASNLRRAAEMTAVPDERVLEIYNALRPYRSSAEELAAIADELETKYGAKICANFVREACQVYKKRGRLKENA